MTTKAFPHHLNVICLALLAASAAQAQTAPVVAVPAVVPAVVPAAVPAEADKAAVEKVNIVGQAASLRSALDKQQAAQGVINVVHADAIGQLPDNNAAEALARLPGVSVERDQGEGRFVRVRGLGADYNAVNINGALTPASEAGRRAPGLDLVPAGLIRSLEVDKTPLPEHDANSLGGTVTVRTLSAFDQPGRLLTLDLGLNHDTNAGRTRPRGAVAFADRFLDGTLGVALALSADQRRFASDNVETGGDWDGEQLASYELRRYEITRERVGGALNIDFKPADGRHFYLRSFSSRLTDDEARQSAKVAFAAPQADGATGSGSVTRSLKARQEINRSSALVLGTVLREGDWKGELEGGFSRASEDKPDAISSSGFKASYAGLGYTNSQRPQLLAPDSVFDGSLYAFDKAKLQQSVATDRVRHVRMDLQRSLEAAGWDVDLKAGLKATRRDKDNEEETYAISAKQLTATGGGFTKTQLNMGNFLTAEEPAYAWGRFGPGLDQAALRKLYSGLTLAHFRDAVDSQTNDFRLKEDVDAGYLQARLEQGGTQLVTGVRLERSRFVADGFSSTDDTLADVHSESTRHHWLPGVLLRQELGSQTQLRAALTNSVVRPGFDQLSPGKVIDGDEATVGNPALKPLRSRNLDLGIEHRLARDASVSAYVFHKRIRDFAFQTDLAGTPGWEAFSHVSAFANGDAAKLTGLEVAYSQALRMLPAPFNGLIVGANASFVHSRATVGGYSGGTWTSRSISLPSQSDRSINLSVGWEGQGLSTRLALNHKSPYLLEVGDVLDAAQDRYVDTQNQLDFSMSLQLDKRWTLSLEALNLSNERYYVYQGSQARNAQYEQYGRSIKVGVKLAL